jgi:hypothetical protein
MIVIGECDVEQECQLRGRRSSRWDDWMLDDDTEVELGDDGPELIPQGSAKGLLDRLSHMDDAARQAVMVGGAR